MVLAKGFAEPATAVGGRQPPPVAAALLKHGRSKKTECGSQQTGSTNCRSVSDPIQLVLGNHAPAVRRLPMLLPPTTTLPPPPPPSPPPAHSHRELGEQTDRGDSNPGFAWQQVPCQSFTAFSSPAIEKATPTTTILPPRPPPLFQRLLVSEFGQLHFLSFPPPVADGRRRRPDFRCRRSGGAP